MPRKASQGIDVRHRSTCATLSGGRRCSCAPAYRAWVFDAPAGKKVRRTFSSLGAAQAWRRGERSTAVTERARRERGHADQTVGQAADQLLAGMRTGAILTRSGQRYKPSSLRGYEQAIEGRVKDVKVRGMTMAERQLTDVRRWDVQEWVEEVRRLPSSRGTAPDPSTVRNALMPLRVIFGRAVDAGIVATNPTTGIKLEQVTARRDAVEPDIALSVITAAPERDRAIWAAAFYAGLRLGELRALQWGDVDFDAGVLRINRSWDAKEGMIDPKSAAGKRRVPIAAKLRIALEEHRARARHTGSDDLVFGASAARAFDGGNFRRRSAKALSDAGLGHVSLHQARHTFASMMIAANVQAKTLQEYMGHSSITVTLDRYGHLFAGSHAEDASRLDAFLDKINQRRDA